MRQSLGYLREVAETSSVIEVALVKAELLVRDPSEVIIDAVRWYQITLGLIISAAQVARSVRPWAVAVHVRPALALFQTEHGAYADARAVLAHPGTGWVTYLTLGTTVPTKVVAYSTMLRWL